MYNGIKESTREIRLEKEYDRIESMCISQTEKAILQNPIISEILIINQKYHPYRKKSEAYKYYQEQQKPNV